MKSIFNAFKGKSMTLNFNAMAIVVFVLDMLAGTDMIKNNPDYAMMITALMNILLRFKTNKKVSDK